MQRQDFVSYKFKRHKRHQEIILDEEESCYDKLPAYLTQLSNGPVFQVRGKADLEHDAILNMNMAPSRVAPFTAHRSAANLRELGGERGETEGGSVAVGDASSHSSSAFACSFASSSKPPEEYCRLPAYMMDISESLQFDADFCVRKLETHVPKPLHPEALRPPHQKVPRQIGSEEEIRSRKILFIANLPRDWSDPQRKLHAILANEIRPALSPHSIKKIQIKQRCHADLDDFAFIYFKSSDASFAALDFFSSHPEYKDLNVSFGGRDVFLNNKTYSDIDCIPEVMHKTASSSSSEAPLLKRRLLHTAAACVTTEFSGRDDVAKLDDVDDAIRPPSNSAEISQSAAVTSFVRRSSVKCSDEFEELLRAQRNRQNKARKNT